LYAHPGDDAAIKIADFGMSRMLKPDQVEMMTCCGTPGYVGMHDLLIFTLVFFSTQPHSVALLKPV